MTEELQWEFRNDESQEHTWSAMHFCWHNCANIQAGLTHVLRWIWLSIALQQTSAAALICCCRLNNLTGSNIQQLWNVFVQEDKIQHMQLSQQHSMFSAANRDFHLKQKTSIALHSFMKITSQVKLFHSTFLTLNDDDKYLKETQMTFPLPFKSVCSTHTHCIWCDFVINWCRLKINVQHGREFVRISLVPHKTSQKTKTLHKSFSVDIHTAF